MLKSLKTELKLKYPRTQLMLGVLEYKAIML
jgi:hypothetical protein